MLIFRLTAKILGTQLKIDETKRNTISTPKRDDKHLPRFLTGVILSGNCLSKAKKSSERKFQNKLRKSDINIRCVYMTTLNLG